MNKIVNYLMNNCIFKEQDAKEIIDIITIKENVKDINNFDYVKAYEYYGARWEEQELLNNYNEDAENEISLEELLKKDFVHVLSSGQIITWNY